MKTAMKTTWVRSLLPALVLLIALPTAALAQPEGAILRLDVSETSDRTIVVGVSERGVVLIGEDLGNFRAFRARALSGDRPFYWVADIDGDRQDEFIFGGDPSFVLESNGDPLFGVLRGCDDFYAGNIIDDEMWELFCRRGSTLTVWNFDGQFLWEYSVRGMRLGTCQADDIDSDERLEFSCEAGSQYALVDIANDEPVQEVPDNRAEMAEGDPREGWMRETTAALSGERTFDIDGDGRAQETFLFNAGTLNLLDSSGATLGSAELGEETLYSVAVGDLNGDRTPEVFVGAVDKIYVISATGEVLSTLEGNPNRLDRDARVTVQSVNANGLEDDSSESARAVLDGGFSSLQRCYDRQLGSDQFIRVGSMFYELTIDGRGRVTRTQKIHSGVHNEDLDSCVENVLEDFRFSGAANGSGSVSIRLGFDFVDR